MRRGWSRKLKDPRWTRLSAKLRGQRKCCAFCGSTTRLQVHHGYYESGKAPWEYPESSLWVLCPKCHRWMDHYRKAAVKLVGKVHPKHAREVLLVLHGWVG